MAARRPRARVGEMLRFGLVGLSSTLLYFGLYSGLALLQPSYVVASVVAFLVSVGWGYVLHHRFTFKTAGPDTQSLAAWLTLQTTLLAVNVAILSILVHVAGLDRILAQLITLPIVPLLSYAVSSRVIFGRR